MSQLKELIYAFSNARMLARSVAIRGGGNRRKPPTLDGRPLPCHMPTPGLPLFILLRLHSQFKELIYAFSKVRMLARSVAIRGGGNRRTRGKPPTLDDPGSQRWQASALTTVLSRPLTRIQTCSQHFLLSRIAWKKLYSRGRGWVHVNPA